KKDGGSLVVSDVVEGSSAALAGIKSKDRITEINGRPVSDLSAAEATELLEGAHKAEFGAKADLLVARGDQPPRQITLKRDYQPAVKWLAEVIARPEAADRLRVFRIDTPEVQQMLGLTNTDARWRNIRLDRREYSRFSWNEIQADPQAIQNAQELLK